MEDFVKKDSIVRVIWGKSDTILFIFAGAAAEFALNKAVDWLFFTGRLPADPLGRLFSTVSYARMIVFSNQEKAYQVIDKMAEIHHHVEKARGIQIPAWAYRDVLYMLIDYSIRAYELLYRMLTENEKQEVFEVFRRVGDRMQIPDLPLTYEEWCHDRLSHLNNNLKHSDYTTELFKQYRKHLGSLRYQILLSGQALIVPKKVAGELKFNNPFLMKSLLPLYKISLRLHLDWYLKILILPKAYVKQIRALEVV